MITTYSNDLTAYLFEEIMMSAPKFSDSSFKSRYVPGQAIKMDIHNSVLPPHKLRHKTPSARDGLNDKIEQDVRYVACEIIQIACR